MFPWLGCTGNRGNGQASKCEVKTARKPGIPVPAEQGTQPSAEQRAVGGFLRKDQSTGEEWTSNKPDLYSEVTSFPSLPSKKSYF